MVIRNLRSGRRLAVLAIFAILATSAFGFAAQNNVPDSLAGDGDGDISGYEISNISYTLSDTTIGNVDEVSFTLDADASSVKVGFNSPATVFDCDVTGGTSVSCDLSGDTVTALAITSLRVVSAQ
jgi:hypothetical protein